jgi:deoxyribose-phosphate aldolase
MNLRVVDRPAPAGVVHKRNPGFPLDLDWVERIRMNRSALERGAATIGTRRTVKKDWQAAWLLKAITLMDLTTLNSDDTPGRVERLCAKARRARISSKASGLAPHRPAAVCVYHAFVKTAVAALEGTGIPVAAVSAPHGPRSKPGSRRSRPPCATAPRRSTSSSPASMC